MTSNPFGLPAKTLDIICRTLAQYQNIEKAVLYGSRAKGSHHSGSDIDLTLQGQAISDKQLAEIAGKLAESSMPYQVDLSISDKINNPNLQAHIQRVGKLLYQRDESAAPSDAMGIDKRWLG